MGDAVPQAQGLGPPIAPPPARILFGLSYLHLRRATLRYARRSMLIYAATIFLSAFLLFQVQPLIAKFILPWFGGSAAVWSAALLFFQLLLLGGYLYAHCLICYLKPKFQLWV